MRKKNEAGKKIKHRRIKENSSCFPWVHSNVSRVQRVRMAVMPKKLNVPVPQILPKQPTFTTALQTSLIQSTSTTGANNMETPQRPKRKATTETNQQSSSKRQQTSSLTNESDESMNSTHTWSPTVSSKKPHLAKNVVS